jgi:2-polyprenyl-3-methyl-5-hydroxy-6-metoxy-1,4-benzoquinol methylase
MSFYSEFAEHYDDVFPFEEEVYSFLSEHVGPRRGSGARTDCRVLDIGCGTGDYCGRFAEEGCEALGVDLDPWMIDRARSRNGAAEFLVLGMEDIRSIEGTHDLVYCIGNVASHLKQEDLSDFLSAVRDLLTEDGVWILQTVNWDFILGLSEYDFPVVKVPESDLTFMRRYEPVSRSGTRFLTRLLAGESEVFDGSTTLYPVESSEYERLHRLAGFREVGHYAGFSRQPFDPGRPSSSVFVFERDN